MTDQRTNLQRTNVLLAITVDNLGTLLDWAFADAEGSLDGGNKAQARADERRAQKIQRAIQLLSECMR